MYDIATISRLRVVPAGVGFEIFRVTSLIRTPPPPLGPPSGPRHSPTVGSYGVAVSCRRGTPTGWERAPKSRGSFGIGFFDTLIRVRFVNTCKKVYISEFIVSCISWP